MLTLSWGHWLGMALAITAVFASIFLVANKESSVEGFSVGGRSASSWLVAGALVGTIVGGSATIGTTQAAVTVGFSAWWFTFGSALGLVALGVFYAGPLRRSGLKTIAEYMAAKYGSAAGVATSMVSVLGIFFSIVASGISGIHFMQVLFPVSIWTATLLLLVTVVVYVLVGGIKGTAVSGIVKTSLLYLCLVIGGGIAAADVAHLETDAGPLLAQAWLYPSGISGWQTFATNCLSVIIGVIVTQSYAQAIYSAAGTKEAVRGSLIAAACCLPIGLPLIAIGLYMGHYVPDAPAVTALPRFMQMYLPPILGGLGLGAILLSIIGSIAGLALGASTSLAVDIFQHGFGIRDQKKVFMILQGSLIMLMLVSFSLALRHYDSQILYWNFLSFSLRGAGLFFPFLLAILAKQYSSARSVAANVLFSTVVAILCIDMTLGGITLNPLYVGMGISALWLAVEYLVVAHK